MRNVRGGVGGCAPGASREAPADLVTKRKRGTELAVFAEKVKQNATAYSEPFREETLKPKMLTDPGRNRKLCCFRNSESVDIVHFRLVL